MNAKLIALAGPMAPKGEHFSSMAQRLSARLVDALDWFLDRLERGRERAQLAQMDARALQDIGLARADIDRVTRAGRRR